MKNLTFLFFIISFGLFGQKTVLTFENNKETRLKGNEKHLYTVLLKEGELLQLHLMQKNVDIKILALSPDKDSIQNFDSPNGKNGIEVVELPIKKSGTYYFKITPHIPESLKDSTLTNFIKNIDGSYEVTKFKVFSPKEYQKKQIFEKAQKDSVISWIRNESITLKSVKAETGLKDLTYLKRILKDVQVVGLGETSHGSKEIFQMKHRMLEFLVKEMGFTLFGIEASHVGCRPINNYVLHDKGNSRDALSAQGFWIWNTEEVIDMIEWIHDYNKTVPSDKKVQFIGIDTQTKGLELAFNNIGSYLKKTENHPTLEVSVDTLFQNIRTNSNIKDLSYRRQQLYTLLSYVIVNKIKLINKSTKQEYLDVIADLRKIIQGVEVDDGKLNRTVDFNIRDEYMAQTTLEVLQKEGGQAKIVLWAHNGHINKNTNSYTNGYKKPLGSVLKRYLGDEKYYAIGFATYQGSFQARNYSLKEKKFGRAASFKIYPAEEGSLDWYFAKSKKDIFFIDFKQPPSHTAIQSFLNKELVTHTASANWTFDYSYSPTRKTVPGVFYDGMIFIKETSSATLTAGGHKEIEKRLKKGK